MLSHCYTPTSFCVSTMIPIPKKGSGSMNDITITITNSLFRHMKFTTVFLLYNLAIIRS